MEVNSLLAEKEQLENRISKFITDEINEFLQKTGVGFDGVFVTITDLRDMTDQAKLYLVATDIKLDL